MLLIDGRRIHSLLALLHLVRSLSLERNRQVVVISKSTRTFLSTCYNGLQCGNYGHLLSPKKYFVKLALQFIMHAVTSLTKTLFITRFYEILSKNVTVNFSQCCNFGNLLSSIFGKNFVRATFSLKKLLSR